MPVYDVSYLYLYLYIHCYPEIPEGKQKKGRYMGGHYIYIYIYIHIYIYVYISLFVYMGVLGFGVHVGIHRHRYTYLRMYIHICMYICRGPSCGFLFVENPKYDPQHAPVYAP